MSVEIEVSYGELVDKVTILEIKFERIKDAAKLQNIQRELADASLDQQRRRHRSSRG